MKGIVESVLSILTVWAIAWRSAWPVMLLFAVTTAYDLPFPRPRGNQQTSPRRGLLLTLWIGPLLLCAWGGGNWGNEGWSPTEPLRWRSWIQSSIAIISIAYAMWLPCRIRKNMGWQHLAGSAFSIALVTIFWSLGIMAMTNAWL